MTLLPTHPMASDIAKIREVSGLPEPARMVSLGPLLLAALHRIQTLPVDDRRTAGEALAEAVSAPSKGAGRTERIRDGAFVGERATW
jgi:hypothetical protein